MPPTWLTADPHSFEASTSTPAAQQHPGECDQVVTGGHQPGRPPPSCGRRLHLPPGSSSTAVPPPGTLAKPTPSAPTSAPSAPVERERDLPDRPCSQHARQQRQASDGRLDRQRLVTWLQLRPVPAQREIAGTGGIRRGYRYQVGQHSCWQGGASEPGRASVRPAVKSRSRSRLVGERARRHLWPGAYGQLAETDARWR
jgi:hypothetical protein